MKLGIITLAIVGLLVACASTPCPANEPRTTAGSCPQSDGGADASTPCGAACTNMRRLGCELGKPTPMGATCERVCENVQSENAGVGFNASCLAKVTNCVDADACR